MIVDKKFINIRLDLFIEIGLTATSTRDLSSTLKLQNASMCHCFERKDEAVIACTEETAMRFENTLIPSALRQIHNPNVMMERLQKRADEMASTMRFLGNGMCKRSAQGQSEACS